MHELAVLFFYHLDNAVTRTHYAALRQSNPDVPIIPISCGNSDYLTGSFTARSGNPELFGANSMNKTSASRLDYLLARAMPRNGIWYGLDAIIYTWFLNRNISASRYIILEWDCLCTAPLRSLYASYWNLAVAVAGRRTEDKNPEWFWFNNYREQSRHLGTIEGVTPIAGMFISHDILSKLANFFLQNSERYQGIFSEIRLGTALKELGVIPTSISPSDNLILSAFQGIKKYPTTAGLYHPIKYLPEVYSLNLNIMLICELWRKVVWKLKETFSEKSQAK